MDKDSSLIEKKVIMVDKIIPAKFEMIQVPVGYEIIYGRLVPTKSKKITRYIPTEYKTIKVPLLIPA